MPVDHSSTVRSYIQEYCQWERPPKTEQLSKLRKSPIIGNNSTLQTPVDEPNRSDERGTLELRPYVITFYSEIVLAVWWL